VSPDRNFLFHRSSNFFFFTLFSRLSFSFLLRVFFVSSFSLSPGSYDPLLSPALAQCEQLSGDGFNGKECDDTRCENQQLNID